jgi:hypothetical protein
MAFSGSAGWDRLDRYVCESNIEDHFTVLLTPEPTSKRRAVSMNKDGKYGERNQPFAVTRNLLCGGEKSSRIRRCGQGATTMTVDAQPETFLVRVLYMQPPAGRRMNDFIEARDEDQFANGQSCRDLRVSSELTQPGFELMEAINSISDFFRFVRISAREIALNHRTQNRIKARGRWSWNWFRLKNIFEAAVEQRTKLQWGSVVLPMSRARIPRSFRRLENQSTK